MWMKDFFLSNKCRSFMGIFDPIKSAKMTRSFLFKRMVHCNLQILYQCNFRCAICDFWKPFYQELPMLSVPQTRAISEKIKPLGPLVISIGGGEPLLHPHLIDIIKLLSVHHFPVMICNGWFITPQNARELFTAGMREISISVDYASSEKHDAQRGKKGSFERAINALQTLHENRIHPNQRVHMISVIMDDNLDDIEPLIKISKEIGVTYLITFYSTCRGKKKAKASRSDISLRLMDLKRKYPEFIALSEFIERFAEAGQQGGIAPCFAGKNLFNIDCQGNVSRCIDHLDASVGNILKQTTESIMTDLAEQARKDDCGACWTSCRGNIETLMYGRRKLRSLLEYRHIVKSIPLLNRV
jgi:MoaA/NifB/PqqE/SkfB family radical SAM enzyme